MENRRRVICRCEFVVRHSVLGFFCTNALILQYIYMRINLYSQTYNTGLEHINMAFFAKNSHLKENISSFHMDQEFLSLCKDSCHVVHIISDQCN